MESSSSHHVAWADRLNYNKVLHDDIEACSMAFGTEYYRNQVLRFYNDIVNIKDGPQLRDMVDKYKKGAWRQKINKELDAWKSKNPELKDELEIVQDEEQKIEDDCMPDLCYFIKQMLEDNGFGFYKTNFEMESKMM